MKTLAEVIKAYEYCIDNNYRDCRGCPYGCEDGESGCTNAEEKADALHYLREYRDLKSTMNWHTQMEEIRGSIENAPLTWDELKDMIGEPVWVEALLYKQWAIIAYVGDEHIRFEGVNLYAPESRVYMGDANGWQAYRKERG